MKHMTFKSAFAVCVGLLVVPLVAPYPSEAETQIGTILTAHSSQALRAAPSLKAPVIWHVEKGDSLTVRKRHGEWLNVRMNNGGRIGWIAPEVIASAPLRTMPRNQRTPQPKANNALVKLRHHVSQPKPAAPLEIMTINLGMDKTDAQVLFKKDPFDESEFQATVQVNTKKIRGVAEVSVLGSSTRYFHKKSLEIKYQRDIPEFYGSKILALHAMASDPSLMREFLAWKLMKKMGMIVPDVSYARLYINGTYKGLYMAMEWIRPQMLERHDVQVSTMATPYDRSFCGDLMEKNINRMDTCWNVIKGGSNGKVQIQTLSHQLENLDENSAPAWFEKHTDLKSIIDWLAINALLGNNDTYVKNYYLVLLPNQHWKIVPADYDLSFGRNWDPYKKFPRNIFNDLFVYYYPPGSGPANPLKEFILHNPQLRNMFLARIKELLNNNNALFNPNHMSPWIAYISRQINHAVTQDPFINKKDFTSEVELLKHYVEARSYYLRHLLFGKIPWEPTPDMPKRQFHTKQVKPNTTYLPPHRLVGIMDEQSTSKHIVIGSPGFKYWIASLDADKFTPATANIHVDLTFNQPPSFVPEGTSEENCVRRSWTLYSKTPGLSGHWTLRLDYFEENSKKNELGENVDEGKLILWMYDGTNWHALPTEANSSANLLTTNLPWNSGQMLYFVACSQS